MGGAGGGEEWSDSRKSRVKHDTAEYVHTRYYYLRCDTINNRYIVTHCCSSACCAIFPVACNQEDSLATYVYSAPGHQRVHAFIPHHFTAVLTGSHCRIFRLLFRCGSCSKRGWFRVYACFLLYTSSIAGHNISNTT